jgi:hypothetical protein
MIILKATSFLEEHKNNIREIFKITHVLLPTSGEHCSSSSNFSTKIGSWLESKNMHFNIFNPPN